MRIPISMAALALLFLVGIDPSREDVPDWTLWTPYADLNWREIEHDDMQIHVHPGLGDEGYDPHQTIDRYHEKGSTRYR